MHIKFWSLLGSLPLALGAPLLDRKSTSAPIVRRETAGYNRRGISYNDNSLVHLFITGQERTTWQYNWDAYDGSPGGNYYEFVPMLWGNGAWFTGRWFDAVAKTYNAHNRAVMHVLGFNEPDICGGGGSCISVSDAVNSWRAYMQPLVKYGDGIAIGSPAVSNGGGDSMGLGYLNQFLNACWDCRIDFINIHWYDSHTNIDYFKAHVNAAIALANGRPVWITEFAPTTGSDDDKIWFLQQVLPWLDSKPEIHRYAYFMGQRNTLVNSDATALTKLGAAYNAM